MAGAYLGERIPWLPLNAANRAELPDVRIRMIDWRHERAQIPSFDRLLRRLERGGDFRLILSAGNWLTDVRSAYEVLNRYQRLFPWPGGTAEQAPLVQRCLESSRLRAPADTLEAERERVSRLDCWCWLHRLEPRPLEELQLAALLGGEVAGQERNALRDARDLAFFGSESWHFLDEQGLASTWTEVRRRLNRMSERAIGLALATRQPPSISYMLADLLQGWGRHAVA